MPTIKPSLWFDTEAEEAAHFYTALFPNSEITSVSRYNDAGPGEAGTVMVVEFTVDGQEFNGINGGPQFPFSEAVSFAITCVDQAEVDRYWDALTAGGEEGQCGWLKDKFGVSWQVVPPGMAEVLGDDNPARAQAAMKAMLGMKRIDMNALKAAADAAAHPVER